MSASCPHHVQLEHLSPPRLVDSVHREECTQCFDDQDCESGVDVCLTCFNGGCLDADRHHAKTHAQHSGHAFTLNVKRSRKPSSKRESDREPPTKMAKLAIFEDREEDKYEHTTTIKCWKCNPQHGQPLTDLPSPLLEKVTDGIMQSMSSARQSEVKAWEEEILACEHTLTLEQVATGPIQASGLAHCNKCDLKENLWLCLTCGALGCGRQQFGGTGGNGHGLQHYEETRHPVSVKLGTITPEGSADIYCYSCNDSKLDPELALHLSTFGINVAAQTKTEKSMTELQIEHNLKFDFSLTGDDGKALQPVYGPGLTGLANLGNSCYMASVTQALFSLPAFQNYYYPTAQGHWETCTEPLPAACVDCQMHKLADGLLSGRYSTPHPLDTPAPADPLQHDSPIPVFQDGVRPASFKALIGRGHAEFATVRQQDAEEFFTHLLTTLRRHGQRVGRDAHAEPAEVFRFGLEQRLQCGECRRVRYRVDSHDAVSVQVPAHVMGEKDGKVMYKEVGIDHVLASLTSDEALEYRCPTCAKNVIATKRSRFATFPEVLVIHAKKFELVNWVPTKLDIPLILPDSDQILLDDFIAHGLQPGEATLPEDAPAADPGVPAFNEAAMAQLEAMGFSVLRCQKALLATGNADPEAAMEWLFAHMEDSDIDDPIPARGGAPPGPDPSHEQVAMLGDMGFTPAQARKALRETGGDMERAVEWLFSHPEDTGEDTAPPAGGAANAPSIAHPGGTATLPARYRLKAFISHKGPSVHSGHYVAHIRVGDEWVLFNDEKVVRADTSSVLELKALAYLYVFERI